MRGKIVVIEGLDGSGKATQAELLCEQLNSRGQRLRKLSFPCYGQESSALARMYLDGEFGEHPQDVSAQAASVLFACDRFASFRKDWHRDYEEGALLVCDRYTTSNAVYQAGKLDESLQHEFLEWLFDFEYRLMGIPEPDLVLYLDIPAELSEHLLSQRYTGDASKMDIHERDLLYQRRCRSAAMRCAAAQNWQIVDCTRDNAMKPAPVILEELMSILERAGLLSDA